MYGTTYSGGAYSGCGGGFGPQCGAVFKLSPKGKETVLYSFCAEANCADGSNPGAWLIADKKGNLYGTTYEGGNNHCNSFQGGCGVVFRLTP